MEGKFITTEGLKAYTQQLKTCIGDIYQTKADMDAYKKTADLFTYLDTRYIAKDSLLYANPIYKHTITVFFEHDFTINLTIFTTRANKYDTADDFRKDWVENRKIISVLAHASHASAVFEGTVVGVIAVSGRIDIRISGIKTSSTAPDWDSICTINEWQYWHQQQDQQSNPCRI